MLADLAGNGDDIDALFDDTRHAARRRRAEADDERRATPDPTAATALGDRPSASPAARVGGLAASLAALLAACGKATEGEPGRVGNAPMPTDLAELDVNDVVYLRTMTSIEYTILDVYAMITKAGALQPADQALVDRFVEDHQAAAETLAAADHRHGGEPFECANAWYMERVVPPIFDNIVGDEAKAIEPSDDPARDMMAIIYALETMDGGDVPGDGRAAGVAGAALRVMQLGAWPPATPPWPPSTPPAPRTGYVTPALFGGERTGGRGRAAARSTPSRPVRQPDADAARDRQGQLGRHPLHAADRDPRRQRLRLRRPDLPGHLSPARSGSAARRDASSMEGRR